MLAPFAALYAAGWSCYRGIYKVGLKKAYVPQVPTVVVGSLQVGGMGKSPTAIAIAQALEQAGRPVVIGMHGYRSPRAEGATVAPAGPLKASEWGDEAAMVRWLNPEWPMIVGRDRVAAAKLAEAQYGDHVLVMDDGLQHLRLAAHIEIALDPPRVPNPYCLPMGPYREPRGVGRRRSTRVLPDPIFQIDHRIEMLRPDRSSFESLDAIPETLQVLTAIARPERVTLMLESGRFQLKTTRFHEDHAALDGAKLLQPFDPQLPICVTAKDWVKIEERPDWERYTWIIIHHSVGFLPASTMQNWLLSQLNLNHG